MIFFVILLPAFGLCKIFDIHLEHLAMDITYNIVNITLAKISEAFLFLLLL